MENGDTMTDSPRGNPLNQVICGNCLEVLDSLPEQSVDLVFGSPPYENARSYGIDFNLSGQGWVDWMLTVYQKSLRVCKGLVAFVVAGRTKNYEWSCTPALLIADMHRTGICVREGPYYHRIGIPGSGGPDWLRHDIEFVVSATNGGKLPWSDNVAMGNPPKYKKPGGPCSSWHKTSTSGYINGDSRLVSKDYDPPNKSNPGNVISRSGYKLSAAAQRDLACPSHGGRSGTVNDDGTITRKSGTIYISPSVPDPGNMISVGAVGGGHLGSKLAHENEAPFPDTLAEFMIRSFCPPDGTVLDPFSGSGTTAAVAKRWGRNYIAIDIRQSQIDLTHRRLNDETRLFDSNVDAD